MLSRVWTFPEMFVDVYVSKNLYFSFIYICTINGFLLPKIPHSWFLKNRDSKKQTQKAWLSDIAIFFHVQIHCACQWIMTLPPKNTVAHSTFEHLEHHNISKIVILPHKSHVSHKYKCMNDGFFINQHADQKKIRPRRTQFYVENDFFKNSRFATAK